MSGQQDGAGNAAPLLTELLAMLESSYPDREFLINRIVSDILVRLKSESGVGKTLKLAATSTEQAEQMHYLFVLRNAEVGWTIDHRRVYFQLLARTSDYIGGQGMGSFLAQIRSDAIDSLPVSERDELASVIKASILGMSPFAGRRSRYSPKGSADG